VRTADEERQSLPDEQLESGAVEVELVRISLRDFPAPFQLEAGIGGHG
jgi:hypothetical protein